MRTSLNDIKHTEDFLSGTLQPEDALLYKAKLILNPVLRWNTWAQKKTYQLVRLYARRKLKAEVKAIQETMFNDPQKRSFHESVLRMFSK